MENKFVSSIPLTYEEYKGILLLIAENAISDQDPYLVSLYYDIKFRWNSNNDDIREDEDMRVIEEELEKFIKEKRSVK